MPSNPALYAALATAQASAYGVEKDKTNSYHQYPYASAEAVILEGRKALACADLAFLTVERKFVPTSGLSATASAEDDSAGRPGKGKPPKTPIGRVEMRYLLVHKSGESLEILSSTYVIPESGRPADKAEAAAVTSDLSYTLRGLLLLPRGLGEPPIDGRDDRDDDDPRDRRADYAPRDERPPSDRPSAETPRSGARAAADRAVEAQTRGPVAQVPTHDPAHLALCNDFVRRARVADIGEGREEPADIHDLILKSDLPKPLRDQALVAVYLRATEIVDDPDVLDGWIRAALSAALDEGQKATLRECFAAADERISKLPPIDAAA
jgi:hypothetical protein